MENRNFLQEISLIDFFASILIASEETEEGEAQNTEAEHIKDIKVEKDDHNDAGNETHAEKGEPQITNADMKLDCDSMPLVWCWLTIFAIKCSYLLVWHHVYK